MRRRGQLREPRAAALTAGLPYRGFLLQKTPMAQQVRKQGRGTARRRCWPTTRRGDLRCARGPRDAGKGAAKLLLPFWFLMAMTAVHLAGKVGSCPWPTQLFMNAGLRNCTSSSREQHAHTHAQLHMHSAHADLLTTHAARPRHACMHLRCSTAASTPCWAAWHACMAAAAGVARVPPTIGS